MFLNVRIYWDASRLFLSAFFLFVSLKQRTYSLYLEGEMGASLMKIRIVALTL